MNHLVIVHDDSLLGKQIFDSWSAKYRETSEFHVVNDCSLDDLEQYHPRLVIFVSDMASEFEQLALDKCRDLGLSILPVLGRESTVLIGPLEIPEVPVCATCLQLRWENTPERSLQSFFQEIGGIMESMPLEMAPSDFERLGDIVADEIHLIVADASDPPNSRGKVGVYDETEGIAWVPIVPSHDCPRCSLMTDDNPVDSQVQFVSHNINDMEALRVGIVDFKRVEEKFVHPQVGYISSVNELLTGDRYIQADAHIYTPTGDEITGYGLGLSGNDAKQSAVFEVLERSCGLQAAKRRPVVFGSCSELADRIVHPVQFGLHSYELLPSAIHMLQPFNEHTKYSWVWAYSTKHKKSVLIPEQIAYYGPTADEKRFVSESSNGCALGQTVEEAALHGIFEVLERDGFLNMWYGKMPAPELKLGSQCPPDVSESFIYLQNKGFEVRLFNLSHDLGIPAICAVAINRENAFPQVVSGSASHLHPYQAVAGALRELSVQVLNLQRMPDDRREAAVSMFLDSSKIRHILDHVAVAALPEAYSRWKFLLQPEHPGRVQTVEEAYVAVAERYKLHSRDILQVLDAVLEDLHARGFDVIVLDQTSIELSYGGLQAVKVLIPGMTPITFGYGLRRVRGLSRLFELPYQLGYASQALTERDLNQDCHPFS